MWIVLFFLTLIANSEIIKFREQEVHPYTDPDESLVVSVCFYRDATKYVTAGFDNFVRIWETSSGTEIHHFDFSQGYEIDQGPTFVTLHPEDGRIFIVTVYARIVVLDPINFQVLHSEQINPIDVDQLFSLNAIDWISNDKFAVAGFDGADYSPHVRVFSSINYQQITDQSWITDYGQDEVINLMRISSDKKKMILVPSTVAQLKLFDIASKTTESTFTGFIGPITWAEFSPFYDEFYVAIENKVFYVYKKNEATGLYTQSKSFDLSTLNVEPYVITTKVKDKIIVAAGEKILFYNRTEDDLILTDERQNINKVFSFDISRNQSLMLVGMRLGRVALWKVQEPINLDPTPIVQPKKDHKLLIILTTTIGGSILIIALTVIICKCCCQSSSVTMVQVQTFAQEDMNKNTISDEQFGKKENVQVG